MKKRISIIYPFNYSNVENNFALLVAIIVALVDHDEPSLQQAVYEMTEDNPDENAYQRLMGLAWSAMDELHEVCTHCIYSMINDDYLLTDAISLGNDTVFTFEHHGDTVMDKIEKIAMEYY